MLLIQAAKPKTAQRGGGNELGFLGRNTQILTFDNIVAQRSAGSGIDNIVGFRDDIGLSIDLVADDG